MIVGSAVNQSSNNDNITIPNSRSQADLQRKVLKSANLSPGDVSYVEAHGTGTGVGDPVEVASIREVYCGVQRRSPLYLSTLKGNIGHTEAAAGVAGLIKVILMMNHNMIPRQASHKALNPNIPELEPDNIVIPRKLTRWAGPRRVACVASYGASGSNATLLVQEMQRHEIEVSRTGAIPSKTRPKLPLCITAASVVSLYSYRDDFLDWLKRLRSESTTDIAVSDVLFNLADRVNHTLGHTITAIVSDLDDLEVKLNSATLSVSVPSPTKPVIMVFGGQEKLFVGLSREIPQSSRVFRDNLDRCHDVSISLGCKGIYPAVFKCSPISDLVTLHTALFAAQFASAQTWVDCGLEIKAIVGHSFGQLVAFCISGMLSLSDTLKLVIGRACLIQTQWGPENGSMLSIRASRQRISEVLATLRAEVDYMEIACHNGPLSHVVVGSTRAIEVLENYIDDCRDMRPSIKKRKLAVTHGFHSVYTESFLPQLAELAKGLDWREPKIHLEICDEEHTPVELDYRLAIHHTRRPVFFQQAVERLARRYPASCWLSAGQDSSIVRLARDSLSQSGNPSFICPELTASNAPTSLAEATLEMWREGQSVQYWPFHRRQKSEYQHMTLPPYSFEKNRHWLPFTRKARPQIVVATNPDQDMTEHEFLAISSNDGLKGAEFLISPKSRRFQALCRGHVMSGKALAPASLYIEAAIRAALILRKDVEATAWTPRVYNLFVQAPLGLDQSVSIRLSLTQLEGSQSSWIFTLSTQRLSTDCLRPSEPKVCSTGTVWLECSSGTQPGPEFERIASQNIPVRYRRIFDDPSAERMSGSHIYRAFDSVVRYGQEFHSVESIASVGLEAAGVIEIKPGIESLTDPRNTNARVLDGFLQPAGFLVNYFNNRELEDSLFICQAVDLVEIKRGVLPGNRFSFYTDMTLETQRSALANVYVFEATRRELIFAALGLRFAKVRRNLLARSIDTVIRPLKTVDENLQEHNSSAPSPDTPTHALSQTGPSFETPRAGQKICEILSKVTGIRTEQLEPWKSLEDLGVDSLAAIEVIRDIRASMGITIPLSTFVFFPDIAALFAYVGRCSEAGAERHSDSCSEAGDDDTIRNKDMFCEPMRARSYIKPSLEDQPTMTAAYNSFQEVRLSYDSTGPKASYMNIMYPNHVRLLRAYIVEALGKLECDNIDEWSEERLPDIKGVLPRHRQLLCQLLHVLEKDRPQSNPYGRPIQIDTGADKVPAEAIYRILKREWPEHASVHRLMHAIGSRLAECLLGKQDGLEIIFGDSANRKALHDFYENWPLFRTPTNLLAEFLRLTFTKSRGAGRFRILEVGAGTGGTTHCVLDVLSASKIPFEYHFTDVSPALVNAARSSFEGSVGLTFGVLDLEDDPPEELKGAFHVIIAANCVHATRSLHRSLANLRSMLREDGVLTLVEATRNIFVFDLIFGLLEGWWLSEDDRTHPLVDELQWKHELANAGFGEVLWTDGRCPDSKIVRVIGAFPKSKPGENMHNRAVRAEVKELVYKKIDGCDIIADVYCPTHPDPHTSRPIGECTTSATCKDSNQQVA